jgi:hypothetical protein
MIKTAHSASSNKFLFSRSFHRFHGPLNFKLMKNRIYIPAFAALLLLSFFSSCERDANVDLPEIDPKLVLVSFITPQDTLITATLTRSQPIFQAYDPNANQPVSNAVITMSGNSGSVQLLYNATLEKYTAPIAALPIVAGATYTLTATTPSGESVEAQTTVPVNNGISGFSVTINDSLIEYPFSVQLSTQLTFVMNDFPAEENYYRFFSAIVIRDTLTNDTNSVRFMSQLFSDNNQDGQSIQSILQGTWSEYDPTGSRKVVGYDFWMFNANLDYFRYHKSLYNYAGDDPFSEPVLIYTNVKNGLGVFAAANGSKVRVYR